MNLDDIPEYLYGLSKDEQLFVLQYRDLSDEDKAVTIKSMEKMIAKGADGAGEYNG